MKIQSSCFRDLLASVVVFLVALPLCMGIAIASGVPPALGLITGIMGGLVVGFLSGSPLQVSGPAAGLSVIIWELVQQHGLAALGSIVLIAGAIQVIAGSLKWGQYFRAVAPPVVYGMLAGIGVMILASQFHVMVDDAPRGSGIENLIAIPAAIYKGISPPNGANHHLAAVVGLVTISGIVLWTRFHPRKMAFLPAPLIAVLAGTLVAHFGGFAIKFIDVPSNLADAISLPTSESMRLLWSWPVLGAALALALVASAETLLCAIAVDRLHTGPRTNFDRELRAQGIGNMVCGLMGALPMTGVIVRSSANIQAGATTRVSAILHGVWLLAFVIAMPGVLRLVPTASLAAILVYTGYKLINRDNVRALAKYGRTVVAIYAATVIGIVVTDLLTGVLIGIGLCILRLLYLLTHNRMRLVLAADRKRADLYLEGAATFFALPRLAALLDAAPPGVALHLHLDKLQHIDHACMDALHAWRQQNEATGSTLEVEWDGLADRFEGARVERNESSAVQIKEETRLETVNH
jgi:MFS superfamily sulfate permease-like transporter